jgi:7-cyano-7-deazaguanine synthase
VSDKTPDSAAIFSGGLDSTTLVYEMLRQDLTPHLISFDYGQRHKRELQYAQVTARRLGLIHDIVDLTGITHLISNSALTSHKVPENVTYESKERMNEHGAIPVPEGHYAEDNMKKTVVPNRNMIMLSIAAGIAVNNGYTKLGTGVHAGDHFVYPDCRPKFIQLVSAAIQVGNEGFGPFGEYDPNYSFVYAPFLMLTKADIAYKALELDVPLHLTWSCYKGGENHCGKCGTCVERLEAIDEAEDRMFHSEIHQNVDKTVYDDNEYWKVAIAEAKRAS